MSMPKTKSFLRRAEYEAMKGLVLEGAILDVGGSKKSGYHDIIGGTHTITTAGIDQTYGIDIEFDAEKIWPIEDGSYTAVLLINLLEHLYDYGTAIRESFRVLSDGGKVVGVVPFMFNVHGSPNDYFRFTKSTIERLFLDAGFSAIEVHELGTGVFSMIYQSLISFVPGSFVATPLIAIAKILDGGMDRLKPGSALSRTYMPLGYYFIATK